MGSPVSSPGEYKLFAEARAKQSGPLRRGAKRENPWRDCAARGVPRDSGQQTTERITIGARRKPIKLLSGSNPDGDGRLTRDEVRGDVNFAPGFDSMDIDRDEFATLEEMRRYLEQTYGVRPKT